MNKPRSLELLRSEIPARVASSAADGFPRVIPVGSVWNGETLIFCSPPNAAKVGYLAAHPNVAITIDSNDFPPIALFMRGTAALETVDGVPDAFIEAARPRVPAEMMAEWEAGTRALYKQMTVITITPAWAKLIDFETTLPRAIEELIATKPSGSERAE